MSGLYIVQLLDHESPSPLCLGIGDVAFGAPVKLMPLQGTSNLRTQWNLDPTSGLIKSAASAAGQGLYLDLAADGVSVIVWFFVLGRQSQTWSWIGTPQQIFNSSAATECVTAAKNVSGAAIEISAPPGSWQQWQFLPVEAMTAYFKDQARLAAAAAPALPPSH